MPSLPSRSRRTMRERLHSFAGCLREPTYPADASAYQSFARPRRFNRRFQPFLFPRRSSSRSSRSAHAPDNLPSVSSTTFWQSRCSCAICSRRSSIPARINSASATPVAAARAFSFLFCSAVMKTCLRTILFMDGLLHTSYVYAVRPSRAQMQTPDDLAYRLRIVRAATLGHTAPMQKKAAKPAVSKQAQPAGLRPKESFQDLILALQQFWGEQGCVILQPYDMEVGAGTFHPATTLRALGPRPWNAAYVQPSRRPKDGRYGENPNRLQHYYQFQVIMKPSPP